MEHLVGVTQLTLLKVKAHNPDADRDDASNFLRWTTDGNVAADSAARAALSQEFTLWRDLADTIAEDCLYQRDHLQQFCRYLVELNIAEVRLRETAMATDFEVEVSSEDLLQSFWDTFSRSQPQGPWRSPPEFSEQHWSRYAHGEEFGKALQSWASVLRWPQLPLPAGQDFHITFLELFVHIVVVTNFLPPVPLYKNGKRRLVPRRSPEGMMQPMTLCSALGIFREAVERYHKFFRSNFCLLSESVAYRTCLLWVGPLHRTAWHIVLF